MIARTESDENKTIIGLKFITIHSLFWMKDENKTIIGLKFNSLRHEYDLCDKMKIRL